MSYYNALIGTPMGTGTVPLNSATTDIGLCVLTQTITINKNTAGTANVDGILYLPPNSQIIMFYPDVTTAWDSASSANLTVGYTSTGTDLAPSTSVATTGRKSFTFTAAQLTAMANITTNTKIYVTVAQTGATTAGAMTFTVTYVQKPTAGSQ